MACHEILQKQAKVGDGSDGLFWSDPWSQSGQDTAAKIRPYLHDLRLHAERALTLIAQARAAAPPQKVFDRINGPAALPISGEAQGLSSTSQESLRAPSIPQSHREMGGTYDPLNTFPSNPTTLHHPEAIDALELGARRLDFIGLKFQLSDEISRGYQRALIAQSSPDKQLHATVAHELNDINNAVNSRTRDLRDNYALLRELYAQTWLRSNRPAGLRPVLTRFDTTLSLLANPHRPHQPGPATNSPRPTPSPPPPT